MFQEYKIGSSESWRVCWRERRPWPLRARHTRAPLAAHPWTLPFSRTLISLACWQAGKQQHQMRTQQSTQHQQFQHTQRFTHQQSVKRTGSIAFKAYRGLPNRNRKRGSYQCSMCTRDRTWSECAGERSSWETASHSTRSRTLERAINHAKSENGAKIPRAAQNSPGFVLSRPSTLATFMAIKLDGVQNGHKQDSG
jgi:hypothetical protein